MRHSSPITSIVVLILLIASLALGLPEAGAAGCAPAAHPGGEWRFMNHDLSNTRYQDSETVIDADRARNLAPFWKFSSAQFAVTGAFQSTPVIADGCLFAASSTGWVIALNADTGELVWKTRLIGTLVGIGVEYGKVYAFPYGSAGPRAVALDQSTGEIVWQTEELSEGRRPDGTSTGTDLVSSPVVFNDMIFVPLSLAYGEGIRVPLYFIDAHTGEIIKQFYALPEKDYQLGYSGAGIWSTAAVDVDNGYLYAGTADSESFKYQHRYNNAIIKIDADPLRPTFGSVVGAYTAIQERYIDEHVSFEGNVICETFGGPDDPLGGTSTSSSNSCLELDLDFGASPNLFINGENDLAVAEFQKAGVFHVIHADTMQLDWVRTLAPPSALGNGSTSAFDGNSLYVSANAGSVFKFSSTFGALEWISHTSDALRYQPLTVANGVVYTLTNGGSLVAIEAATGLPLLNRPITADVGRACIGLGSGVAVARNTVYAPCDSGSWIVAYR